MNPTDSILAAKTALQELIPKENREQAAQAIAQLLAAQASSDVESVEVVVPTKSVSKVVDLGPVTLKDTSYGVLFQAKGSLSVLVDTRQQGLCDHLRFIMEQIEKDFPESENIDFDMEAYAQSWLYVLQAPLFCQLDPAIVAQIATLLVNTLKQRSDELLSQPVSEPDIETSKADASFQDIISLDAQPSK